MNYRSVAKNYAIALLAQGVSTFAGIATGFLVPKVLGVAEFGYYQLFVFYATYVGLCHLGLTDGVYLIMGGKTRDELDNRSVKSQLVVGLTYESLFSVALVFAAILCSMEKERSLVLIVLSFYLLVKNIGAYLGYVLQAVNETRLFSTSTIVEKGLFVILVLLFLALGVDSFVPYALAFSLGSLAQMAYCAAYTRDILASRMLPFGETLLHAAESIRVGSKLLVANLASSLILGVARIAIDNAWGIETFGRVSFSLSMVSFFLTFITQASMVLFPALRAGGDGDIKKFYEFASTAMGLLFPVAYLLYCPMCLLVYAWLPAYADSVRYLVLLLPVCVFDSKMNISCMTLYKVRREEAKLLVINLATLVACSVLVGVSVYLIGSVEMALASAAISIIGRSVYSEWDLNRSLDVKSSGISLWEVLLTIVFTILATFTSATVTFVSYGLLYAAFLFLNKAHIGRFLLLMRRLPVKKDS